MKGSPRRSPPVPGDTAAIPSPTNAVSAGPGGEPLLWQRASVLEPGPHALNQSTLSQRAFSLLFYRTQGAAVRKVRLGPSGQERLEKGNSTSRDHIVFSP